MFPPFIFQNNPEETKRLVLDFINVFSPCFFLDSNSQAECPVPVIGTNCDFIAAAGSADEIGGNETDLNQLQKFIDDHQTKKNWIFGYLTYDVKNQIEKMSSGNPDAIGFPGMHFFVPQYLIVSRNGITEIISKTEDPETVWKLFLKNRIADEIETKTQISFSHIPGREEYLNTINKILKHIQRGDIYELNYCRQIAGTASAFNPLSAYLKLVNFSPAPFACYIRLNHNYLLCASPERFIAKTGNEIISQPIKGTARRGTDPKSDLVIKTQLSESEKERSENVMIVDLVRNDLSKFAVKGSVNVKELFGVYTFAHVHQMISTVSCEVKQDTSFAEVIRAAFPMGSMTGAPKVSAMKIIDELEDFRRGLYSGSAGYISPDGNFDFNVIIRSILYNSQTKTIGLPAGGAITIRSNPEDEYEEMLLKLKPQFLALGIDFEKLFNSTIHNAHA